MTAFDHRRRALQRMAALPLAASLPFVGGCASPQVQQYAQEKPNLDLRTYFNGKGFNFVHLNQLAMEHLMGARG